MIDEDGPERGAPAHATRVPPSIPSTTADGYSTLVVCGIIVIGATAAVLTWMREVYVFLNSKPMPASHADYRQLSHA